MKNLNKYTKWILPASLLIALAVAFNNCSGKKFSSVMNSPSPYTSSSSSTAGGNDVSTGTARPLTSYEQSGYCVVYQLSPRNLVVGQNLVYSFYLPSTLRSPEYSCDRGRNWNPLPFENPQVGQFGGQRTQQSVQNLTAGIYDCRARARQADGTPVFCQGAVYVTFSSSTQASTGSTAAIAQPSFPSRAVVVITQTDPVITTRTPPPAPVPVSTPAPVPAPSVPVVTTPTPTPTTPAVSSPSNYVLAPPDSQYTTDENLPDPFQAFLPLRQGQWAIGNSHVVAETGSAGARFPSSGWNIMGPNSKVRLAVLIPPGANVVGWGTEFNYFVQLLGSCGEGGRNCHDESSSPRLWPESAGNTYDPTFDPMKIPAITSPKVVYLTIKSTGKDAWLMSLNVNYQIKDPALYEAWRSQRRWAGGPGDCDGLGDIYASGPNCDLPGRR